MVCKTLLAHRIRLFRADYHQLLKPTQFSNFRAGCWGPQNAGEFVGLVNRHHPQDPTAAFNTPLASKFIFTGMAEPGGAVFSKMTPVQVEGIISDPERCKALDGGGLSKNLNKEAVKQYSNACLLNFA